MNNTDENYGVAMSNVKLIHGVVWCGDKELLRLGTPEQAKAWLVKNGWKLLEEKLDSKVTWWWKERGVPKRDETQGEEGKVTVAEGGAPA